MTVVEPSIGQRPTATPAPREERLIRLLERAAAGSQFSISERWLFGAGGALASAGFIFIIVGWVGASRTVLVAGQIPYLISGGLIGLGCIFLGGFLYFGRWMAVLVREQRERGAEDRNQLADLRDGVTQLNATVTALLEVVQGPPANGSVPKHRGSGTALAAYRPDSATWREGPAPTPAIPRPAHTTAPPVGLVATRNGSMVHRADCSVVARRDNLRSVDATDGLKPCGMCRPLDDV